MRESGDRLSSDEYNRWLLSPELLLQRRIRTELPDPAGEMGKSVRLNATIYRFEFDRARHTAVLSVEFSGKAGDVTERTSQLTYETPYEGDAPEAAAKAMAVNAERAAQAVRELIASLSKK